MEKGKIMSGLSESHVESLRQQFPALARTHDGLPVAYLDGPAGTQVPLRVINAMVSYYSECNANHGGRFPTSIESDRRLDEAHEAYAEFFGASDAGEVYFGQNMTSLTFALSRAISRMWSVGDEIIVSRLDHDANVTPWVRAAADVGVTVRFVEIDPTRCVLDVNDFYSKLSSKTKLVALGGASNAVGTLNPIQEMVRAAKLVGAETFIDAVHLAPHRRLDVKAWGCDYVACSPYKFFGPHLGVMWGRRKLLESLPAYKVRPATEALPGRWMTGTQSHESICGAVAALDYLSDLGRHLVEGASLDRAQAWEIAFAAIAEYEARLAARFLDGVKRLKRWRLWGIDSSEAHERVSTFALTHEQVASADVAERLGEQGIFVWHGNYYALQLSETLGQEPNGMVRVGFVHYNTEAEVDRVLEALSSIR